MHLMARQVILSNADRDDFMRNEYTLTFKGVTIDEVLKLLAFGPEAAEALKKLYVGGERK